MDLQQELSGRPYYNQYSRKFAHYYDVYFTNKEKVDRIMITSLQKDFSPSEVLDTLDQIWKDCLQRESDYLESDGSPVSTAQVYFEAYLRNVIRKILVFDKFGKVFASV